MLDPKPKYPLLVLDTASRRTWVGLKLGPQELRSKSEEQDPSKSLFRLVASLLTEAAITLAELGSIAFCSGPGSMLGARTTSMAIRAWKGIGIPAAAELFTYNSLQIGALIAADELGGEGLIVTDARRSSWNSLPFPLTATSQLALLENAELETLAARLATFAEFPSWTKTKAELATLSYDPTPIFTDQTFLKVIKQANEAVPLTIRANEFKKWDAKIHSAPIL